MDAGQGDLGVGLKGQHPSLPGRWYAKYLVSSKVAGGAYSFVFWPLPYAAANLPVLWEVDPKQENRAVRPRRSFYRLIAQTNRLYYPKLRTSPNEKMV